MLRLQSDLPNISNIGVIGLNQESLENADYERSFGIDGNFFLSDNTQIGGYIAKSFNPELSNKSLSGVIDFLYNDDLWNFYASQSSIGNDFSAEVGFFPRTGVAFGSTRSAASGSSGPGSGSGKWVMPGETSCSWSGGVPPTVPTSASLRRPLRAWLS